MRHIFKCVKTWTAYFDYTSLVHAFSNNAVRRLINKCPILIINSHLPHILYILRSNGRIVVNTKAMLTLHMKWKRKNITLFADSSKWTNWKYFVQIYDYFSNHYLYNLYISLPLYKFTVELCIVYMQPTYCWPYYEYTLFFLGHFTYRKTFIERVSASYRRKMAGTLLILT